MIPKSDYRICLKQKERKNADLLTAELERAVQKKGTWVKKSLLFALWAGIIVFCWVYRDVFSVESIAALSPQNKVLAAVLMLAFFALKSLSVVLYSGLLYAAAGLLFPLPVAILVNLFGTVIMVSLPYWIGKKTETGSYEDFCAKYPKAKKIHELRQENDIFFSFLCRMLRLPSDLVSLYMGAIGVSYPKYLCGSVFGMLPLTITFPLMGMNVQDPASPEFLIALGMEAVYVFVACIFYVHFHRKKQQIS